MESICVLFRLSLSLLLSLSLAKLCPLHSTNDLLQTGIIAMSGNADANNCVSADITYPIADRSVTGIGCTPLIIFSHNQLREHKLIKRTRLCNNRSTCTKYHDTVHIHAANQY